MASKTVSFRLSDEVVSAIEAHAKAKGQTRTAVVVEALTNALGVSRESALGVSRASPDSSVLKRLIALEQRVAALEQEKAQRSQSTPTAIAGPTSFNRPFLLD